jgi:tannase
VVARTDPRLLNFDISSVEGKSYSCAASPAAPAQTGNVSAKAIRVAKTIINRLHDSQGRRFYFFYQPSAAFDDAKTQYNRNTGEWELSINQLGGEHIALLVNKNGTTLDSLDDVTYDTLKISGMQEYYSTLQTSCPDLTHKVGGKVIHYHGDADFSIPLHPLSVTGSLFAVSCIPIKATRMELTL